MLDYSQELLPPTWGGLFYTVFEKTHPRVVEIDFSPASLWRALCKISVCKCKHFVNAKKCCRFCPLKRAVGGVERLLTFCTLTTEQPTEEGYTGSAAMIRARTCEIRRVE